MVIEKMTYSPETNTLPPPQTIDLMFNQLEHEIQTNQGDFDTKTLRSQSRDVSILMGISPAQFTKILTLFKQLKSASNQFDIIVLISNIMLMNHSISTFNAELSQSIRSTIPFLYEILDTISERKIISEAEYSDYLPIFRLYFLLLNYSRENLEFLQELRPSIKKISSKLLNFISMSSLKSKNLNMIIIEILKILYSFIHLSMSLEPSIVDSSITESKFLNGIDSSLVLGCNKFNLLYTKVVSRKPSTSSQDSPTNSTRNSIPSRSSSTSSNISNFSTLSGTTTTTSITGSELISDELAFNTYDDILFHFGNIILVIPTSISKNYMLNKVKFTENIIYYLNKYYLIFSMNRNSIIEDDMISKVTSNLLTMDILLSIDDEAEVKKTIQDNLTLSNFNTLIHEKSSKYDNLKIVLSELAKKIQEQNLKEDFLKETLQNISESSNLQTTKLLEQQVNVNKSSGEDEESIIKQPTEEEIDELCELFDKIENNGIFKISMK